MNQVDEDEIWKALWGIIEIDLFMHYDMKSIKLFDSFYYDYQSLRRVLQVPIKTLDTLLFKESAVTIPLGSTYLISIENVIGIINLYNKDFSISEQKEQQRLYLLGL